MKKLFVLLFLGGLFTTAFLLSCNHYVSDEENAAAIFKAIANNDPGAFNWITVEDVDKFMADGKNKEKIAKVRDFASDIEKNAPPLLAEWRQLGEAVGINWQDIKVDSVDYWGDSEDNVWEELGTDAKQGFIFVTSGGRRFKIKYDQAIGFGDGWRTVILTDFLPLDENGKVISSMTLKQDGTFEEFYHSLAECIVKYQENEIDKVFLVSPNGEVVFQIPSYEESFEYWKEGMWKDECQSKDILRLVDAKEDYIVEEMNPAMLLEYGIVNHFGLDENEILDHAELVKVGLNLAKQNPDPNCDLICGKFMKYKGKWYFIGDFDSGYEH